MNPELKLLGISQKTYDFVKSCENSLGNIYEGIEANEAYTQARVLKAFQDNCIALRHFAPTSGYGYDDIGREAGDIHGAVRPAGARGRNAFPYGQAV